MRLFPRLALLAALAVPSFAQQMAFEPDTNHTVIGFKAATLLFKVDGTFRKWRTGGTTGVVSVGQDQQYWCKSWIEDPVTKVNNVSDKQAKSMMRSFRSGRL